MLADTKRARDEERDGLSPTVSMCHLSLKQKAETKAWFKRVRYPQSPDEQKHMLNYLKSINSHVVRVHTAGLFFWACMYSGPEKYLVT